MTCELSVRYTCYRFRRHSFHVQKVSHLFVIERNNTLCFISINHNYGQSYSCMKSQSFSWSSNIKLMWTGPVFDLQLKLFICMFLWSETVNINSGDVRMMLTWFIFSMPLSLPSSSISTSCTNNHPVLEYRDKLFTQSNQKPASKERMQQQGIVKLSPPQQSS